MKLLIADDEKLTREGIRDNLDLQSLGITQVFLADDGIHGLETGLREHADIVLTDVRMPRMNGVQMAEKLLAAQPDTVIIFMSAYSDKEYLKAAIKLKAVSYVEKPLDMEELASAVREAVENCRTMSTRQVAARSHEKELLGHLSMLLTEQNTDFMEEASGIINRLSLSITPTTCFCALIVESRTPLSLLPEQGMEQIRKSFTGFVADRGMHQMYLLRADRYIIIFLYSGTRQEEEVIWSCAKFLSDQIRDYFLSFISVGPMVSGMERAHVSFLDAQEYLKESFFHEYGSILTKDMVNVPFHPPADVMLDFTVALAEKQEEHTLKLADRLYRSIVPSSMLGASQVKDIYYRYFSKLDEHSMNNYISLWQKEGLHAESIWDGVMGCATLKELHELLCAKLRLYFEQLKADSGENPIVFQIKEFIRQNYGTASLSVPDVSEHVHLSPSYVCTIFKNETGQTLNQYLTDYRIKMSKQFLSDPRYKITDISSKVGYSDGNYYSKAFKKLVGLSPSEYREKMLS